MIKNDDLKGTLKTLLYRIINKSWWEPNFFMPTKIESQPGTGIPTSQAGIKSNREYYSYSL